MFRFLASLCARGLRLFGRKPKPKAPATAPAVGPELTSFRWVEVSGRRRTYWECRATYGRVEKVFPFHQRLPDAKVIPFLKKRANG